MVELVELHGAKAGGTSSIYDPRGLSDQDAGVLFLMWLNDQFIELSGRLGKCDWWNLKCHTEEAIDWVGEKGKAVLDYTGDKVGSAVRLLTDEEVRAGIKDYGTAYMTGGGSVALEQFLQQGGLPSLSQLGQVFKGGPQVQQAGFGGFNVDPQTLLIGGGVVVSTLILITMINR